MKTVNSIIILVFFTFLSCNKKHNVKSEKNILNSTSSYVNYNADSVYYKLNTGSESDKYYHDEKSNLLYLVTREVYVGDKSFGGYKEQDWSDAKNYSKKIDKRAYLVTKIKIKKVDETYEDVWEYKNEINFNEEGYGLFILKIFIEESYAEYNGKVQNRLHINFKKVDYDDGYKLYTLNYIYNKKTWELVSRERICTIPNDINQEELGYCIDTINYRCKKKGNKFDLTYDDIFNLDSGICNEKL